MKKCCGMNALRIAVGITMLVLLLAGSSGASTITVNASGSGDYTRIQDAIDNASTGDTILVYRGIYYENVNVTKQLILRGIGNPMVDAGRSGSAITLSANGITLEGFATTGGGGNWNSPEVGIKLSSSNNTLIGNNASNNRCSGISLSYSSNNTLIGNIASNNGYDDGDDDIFGIGISLSYSSNNTITGNNASNNYEFGISLSDSSNNMITGNNASNNYEFGISLSYSSNNMLSGNTVSNNWGGISLSDYSDNNILSGNNASNNGIGISLTNSRDNTLTGNMMTRNHRNFVLRGEYDSNFDNYIDKSNLVDGRSIYYIIKVSDTTYDSSSNAGTFYCISCVNVTIKNLNLNKNGFGIYFWNTTQSRIQNVNSSDNEIGISLSYSSNSNTLIGNNASNNSNGIFLSSSNSNTLIGNNVSNNSNGICLYSFSNSNTLTGNNASNNFGGISLQYSSNNNMLSGNNASNNYYGIPLESSVNNTLIGNNVSNNENGISLGDSSNNTLIGNIMIRNHRNFGLNVNPESDFDNHIDKSNLVDGRPIYYIIKVSDTTYDSSSNAGTFYCISCVNVTIKNLNLNKNGFGIYFWNTSQSKIQNVNASNNNYGIYLSHSSNSNTLMGNNASNNWEGFFLFDSNNNTLSGNNASNNFGGIFLFNSSNNNKIFNNIFNNTNNANNNGNNIWSINKTSGINIIGGPILGGNFWANPEGTGFSQTCMDMNNNGICENRYILDENNIDYLPLSLNFTRDTSPPKSVSNLKNVTYAKNYINWTWTDPKNIDFKKVMVLIDNELKGNVSKGKMYYNATNFKSNTRHTISTRTVDRNGNINKTWTNHSAWTAK